MIIFNVLFLISLAYLTHRLNSFAVTLFVIVQVLFSIVDSFITDDFALLAYVIAALFDFAIITALTRYERSKLADLILSVSLISIFVNGFGALMWMYYLPPYMYNFAIIALEIYTLYALIRGSRDDYGRSVNDPLDSGDIYLHIYSRDHSD